MTISRLAARKRPGAGSGRMPNGATVSDLERKLAKAAALIAPYRESFTSFGDFLQKVADADRGAPPDRRLEHGSRVVRDATGLGITVPSAGGFLMAETWAAGLWQRVLDTGSILRRCDRQPVTVGNELNLPGIDEISRADGSRFGGAVMTWLPEGEAASASRPKFANVKLQPKRLLGLLYATAGLMDDAPALGAWMERIFGLEASFEIENETINGLGSQGPLGILKSGALIEVTPESGQGPLEIRPANFAALAGRLYGPSHENAVWLMGNDAFSQIATASFANNSPVIETGADGTRRILGMPLLISEYPAALGSLGDIILADFSQYLIGEKAPEFVSSIHVRFLQDEGAFRLRYRVDGQPAWRSPVTPANSSTTVSPFVTLGVR